jgi:hypothetical protein
MVVFTTDRDWRRSGTAALADTYTDQQWFASTLEMIVSETFSGSFQNLRMVGKDFHGKTERVEGALER